MNRQSERDRVQTIEATAKRWKAIQLIGIVAVLAATVGGSLEVAETATDPGAVRGWAIAFGVGLATVIIGRVGAWWYHG